VTILVIIDCIVFFFFQWKYFYIRKEKVLLLLVHQHMLFQEWETKSSRKKLQKKPESM
jgi:hypothetical protein